MSAIKKYPFAPGILFFLFTLFLFTLPGDALPSSGWLKIPNKDKIVHYCLFFLVCHFFSLPVKYTSATKSAAFNWLVIISLLAIGYGIAIEFVQKWWIPNRSFELWDIVADSTGSIAAFVTNYMRFKRNNWWGKG